MGLLVQLRRAGQTTKREAETHRFAPEDLLNALGLEGAPYKIDDIDAKSGLSPAILSDGTWDERSGGGVAVKTWAGLDGQSRLRQLSTDYMCLQPDGHYEIHKLCELKTGISGRGLKITELTIFGHAINLDNSDQVARLLGALKTIHADIRQLSFPEIAKIFKNFQILDSDGKIIDVPGLSSEGGFRFSVPVTTENRLTNFSLPQDFFLELLGAGTNNIDPAFGERPVYSQIGVNPRSGESFRFHSELTRQDSGHGTLTASISAYPQIRGQKESVTLFDLAWQPSPDHDQEVLINRSLLHGHEGLSLPPQQRQRRMGVINAANRDVRRRKYPAVPDHMAVYGQHDLIDMWHLTENLSRHPQMIVIPFGGHGDREYLPGFGDTIGGNCKGIFSCWRDEQDRVRRKGVLVDVGELFNKMKGIQAGEHGAFDCALPDLTGFLNDFDDILITHLHADHMKGIVHMARCELVADKTVHLAEYDCRVLQQFLKQEGIPPKQWPKFNLLDGEGWIHIADAGQRVMSVFYSTNAISHSTKVTAFGIANAPYLCNEDGSPVEKTPKANPHYWSYTTFGDMRFAPYNLPEYKGEKPLDTGFKPQFFNQFKDGLRQHYPAIPARMSPLIDQIAVAEIDATSIDQEGFSNDIVTAKAKWDRLQRWFPDKGFQIHSLSTSQSFHQLLMEFAVDSGRNITADGAFLEARWRDMNVMGVNTDILPRHPDGGNIQKYLDLVAGMKGAAPVLHLGRASEKMKGIIADTPEHAMLVCTGTQGSAFERDSVGTKSAHGASRFYEDPKYSGAAYDANPQDYIVVYGQGAIPGNAETQLEQLRQEAYGNDRIVVAAIHNDTRFFNLKEPYYSRIMEDLGRTGEAFTVSENGELLIHKSSFYTSGHGKKEDFRQGFLPHFKRNNVKAISVQHFARSESVRVGHALADEIGLEHPPEPISNGQIWTMRDGRFHTLAKLTPSFILARINRRADKYHGGTVEYKRAVFRLDEPGLADNGLFAANTNTIFFQDYGATGIEAAKHDAILVPERSRGSFDRAMTQRADRVDRRSHLATRGSLNPFAGKRPIPPHIAIAGLR